MEIFSLIVLFLFLMVVYNLYMVEEFSLRLAQPNKIFSNESSIGINNSNMYKAFPTKCFSCERELERMGIDPMWSNRTKCLSCENAVAGSNPLRNIGFTAQ